MAVRREWDLMPFGDALSGPGGMADPVAPPFAGALTADVFSDALSTTSAGAVPTTSVAPALLPGVAPVLPPAPPVPRAAAFRAAPAAPVITRAPARPAARPVPYGVPGRGMSPTGFPPQGYPPPVGAAQAYPRPAASGYPAPGWAPLPALPGGPTYRQLSTAAPRPPEFGNRPPSAGRPPPTFGARPPNPGSRPPVPPLRVRPARKKSSGVRGVLFVLLIVLITSGLGQKIITAISELLQRR